MVLIAVRILELGFIAAWNAEYILQQLFTGSL